MERFGWTFAPGEKVVQIENDKEVYNGRLGYVDDVDVDAGELTASFDGHTVTYGSGKLDTLVPAYAATIHKSQGSKDPAVVIPLLTQRHAMLQRNLLYTGVTRGKKLVLLIGEKQSVTIAAPCAGAAAMVEVERMARRIAVALMLHHAASDLAARKSRSSSGCALNFRSGMRQRWGTIWKLLLPKIKM